MNPNIPLTAEQVRLLLPKYGCTKKARAPRANHPIAKNKIYVHWLQKEQGPLLHIPIHKPRLVQDRPSVVGWRAYHTAWTRAHRQELRRRTQ